MKLKLSRKFQFNQFLVTALAVMIAIAGYLTYKDTKSISEQQAEDAAKSQALLESEKKAEEVYAADSQLNGNGEIASQDEDEPGNALFVNGSSDVVSFAAQAKLTREQARAKSKEALLEIIDNESLEEASKTEAADAMVTIADNMEKENAAETLLAAKGFANAVVTITEGKADVVLDMENVDDAGRAQIEEVIKTKTGVSVENITITPLKAQED